MIKKIIDYLKKLDIETYKIIKTGLIFCFSISLLSSFIMITYIIDSSSLNTYYIGLALFKLSCYLGVEFIVCGLVMDTIKKQLI